MLSVGLKFGHLLKNEVKVHCVSKEKKTFIFYYTPILINVRLNIPQSGGYGGPPWRLGVRARGYVTKSAPYRMPKTASKSVKNSLKYRRLKTPTLRLPAVVKIT